MLFQVKSLDAERNVRVASIDAPDAEDARRQLSERGMRVISVVRDFQPRFARKRRFPIVVFSQQLVALLQAGLSLVEAIDTLTEKEDNDALRRSLEQVRARLFEGRTLSFALEELPATFPPLYVATIRASEKSGAIQEALTRYVSYQEQIDALKKRVKNASIYPVVLCVAGLVVSMFLLLYVVPSFSGIYEDLGSSIPAASRLLMRWGQLLSEHTGLVLSAGAGGIAFLIYLGSMRSLRQALLTNLAKIPAIGQQLYVYQLARFYRTVGMLLRGGMPAVTAMKMSSGLLNDGLRDRLLDAVRRVSEGKPFADSLDEVGLTTAVASRMLRVGQRGGNMGEMMERIAAFYDEELDRAVDVLTRLIEPLLMIVIGLIIGLIVVLMYFPIFELAGSIQ